MTDRHTCTPNPRRKRPQDTPAPRSLAGFGALLLVPLLSLSACSGPEAPPARSRAVLAPAVAADPAADGGAHRAPSCAREAQAVHPIPLPRGAQPHDTRALPGGLTLRIHRAPYGDVVTLRRGKTLLYNQDGYRFEVARAEEHGKRVPLAGRDINGDHAPELVLREWSGGAHCCNTFTVIRLTPCPRRIATLRGEHGGRFEDRDGDGVPEFIAPDPAVHHWGHFYIWQMAPEIVYAWHPARKGQREGYRPSARLMTRPAPKKRVLRKWTRDVWRGRRRGANCCREIFIFEDLLRLLYTGHERLAWKHLERAWRKSFHPRRGVIKGRMQRLLKRSKAWQTLSRQWQKKRSMPRRKQTSQRKRRRSQPRTRS